MWSSCVKKTHQWCNGLLTRPEYDRSWVRVPFGLDYKIGFVIYFAKHTALRRNSKDWLARNRDNVSELSNMSVCRQLFQCFTIKIDLIQSRHHYHLVEYNLFFPWFTGSWKFAHWALNYNYSLIQYHMWKRYL